MTREEAREILTHNWTRVDNPNYSESELDEAFFMAIEALEADAVSRDVYDKRTKADEEIIDSYREKLANCHKEILRLLDFNDNTESQNDVIKPQNDVIKKPRTVRYKLHKPIEYVSIEYDEEETVTDIAHYIELVHCKDCKHLEVINTKNTYAICHEHDIIFEPFEDSTKTNFCSWGERKDP